MNKYTFLRSQLVGSTPGVITQTSKSFAFNIRYIIENDFLPWIFNLLDYNKQNSV